MVADQKTPAAQNRKLGRSRHGGERMRVAAGVKAEYVNIRHVERHKWNGTAQMEDDRDVKSGQAKSNSSSAIDEDMGAATWAGGCIHSVGTVANALPILYN